MANVLMIAYEFPPAGGSGVQRTSKFAKYLPEFDWSPVVFTRDDNVALKDTSLLVDAEKSLIIRTKAHDYSQWSGKFSLLGKVIRKYFLVPDGNIVWKKKSTKKAKQVVIDEKIDIIYSTSTPYSDHLLGLELKKEFPNIPWVVDFRDEWTMNPYTLDEPYNFIRTKMEKKMELQVMESADAVVINTPIMRKNFIEMYPFIKEKSYVIPNGYDSEDFPSRNVEVSSGKLRMLYTGLLYGRRKPNSFLEGLSEAIANGVVSKEKIEVFFIGNYIEKEINKIISDYSLSDVVKLLPYMPHGECLQNMVNADVLLLIEGTGRGAEAFYTGKVFEYMKSGRTVLGILPPKGVAADLISEANIGLVCDYDNSDDIANGIVKLYNEWEEKGHIDFSPKQEVIDRYERKNLTKELVNIFDTLRR